MDEQLIASLCGGDLKSAAAVLERLIHLVSQILKLTYTASLQICFMFNDMFILFQNTERFSFPELNANDLRIQLWSALFEYLQNSTASSIHSLCLANIRILR